MLWQARKSDWYNTLMSHDGMKTMKKIDNQYKVDSKAKYLKSGFDTLMSSKVNKNCLVGIKKTNNQSNHISSTTILP